MISYNGKESEKEYTHTHTHTHTYITEYFAVYFIKKEKKNGKSE